MTIRCLTLALFVALAPQAQAGSLSFSTTFSLPVLVTDVPDPNLFTLFVQPNNVIRPLETGTLRISFDESQLVRADAPDGVTARFVLPTRLQDFGSFQDLTADYIFDLTTQSGHVSSGPDFIGFNTPVAATFDIIDGPVRQLRVMSWDFSGGLELVAFDPSGTSLRFDLSDPQQLFAAFPGELNGLVGTLKVFDQAGDFLSGLVLPNAVPASPPVPEPGAAALFAIGTVVAGWKVRRMRRVER